ncbi:MAG: hypothetical protein ACJAT2_001927 [Bacteriovoracaceae bacterium]|jgi:uncharacterized protein with PIN domain
MDSLRDYEFEYLEKYFGDASEVQKKIENCPVCNEKLAKSHQVNLKELYTRETARCNSCGYGQKKLIHSLN